MFKDMQRRVAIIILTLFIALTTPLCFRFATVAAESSGDLVNVVREESARLEVFPLSIACNSSKRFQYEARYELSFERYRPFYNLCQAPTFATSEDVARLIDAFPTLSTKERASAALVLYLYEQRRRKPSDSFRNGAEASSESSYDETMSEEDWEKLVDAIRSCVDDPSVAFEALGDFGLVESWEAGIRWNFLRLQTILGTFNPLPLDAEFAKLSDDFHVASFDSTRSQWLHMAREFPAPFLYALALIETELAATWRFEDVESLNSWDLQYDSERNDLAFIMSSPDWRALKERGIVSTEKISNEKAREEIDFIRAALLTQFAYSRQGLFSPLSGNCSVRFTLGAIAESLLASRSAPRSRRPVAGGAGTISTPVAASASTQTSSTQNSEELDEELLDCIRRLSERVEVAPEELVFALGDLLDGNVEYKTVDYAIPYGSFRALYHLTRVIRGASEEEFERVFDAFDSMTIQEKALAALSTRLYCRLVESSNVSSSFSQRAQTVCQAHHSESLDKLRESSDLEFRRAFLYIQRVLEGGNPFFHAKSHDFDYWLELLEVATREELVAILDLELDERVSSLDLPFVDKNSPWGSAFYELNGDSPDHKNEAVRVFALLTDDDYQQRVEEQRAARAERYNRSALMEKYKAYEAIPDLPTDGSDVARFPMRRERERDIMRAYLKLQDDK